MPLKGNDSEGAVTRKRIESYIAARESVTEVAETDAAQTLTAAELLNSKLFTCTPTAARDFTTATAAQIVAALADEIAGTSFEFTIVNKAASTHAITLVGGTDVTINGAAAVAAATSGTFIGVVQSNSTVKVYRK
jgi:hypothetical protein